LNFLADNWLLWGFIGVMALIVILALVTSKPGAKKTPLDFPYQREEAVLSKAERFFYFALYKAVHERMHIFPKVRLIDIVKVRPGVDKPQHYRNRIIQQHVDFVLCERDTFKPLLVIELDDASHRDPQRQDRDARKDRVLEAAGLPILRYPAKANYNMWDVARAVEEKLGIALSS
jgi:hypothetical protein